MTKKLECQSGFSLAEMIITTLLVIFIFAALHTSFLGGNSTWQTYNGKVRVQNDARNALLFMTKELRQGSGITVTQDTNNTTVNFTREAGGAASFSWSTSGSDANRIIFQTQSGSRIIANNVSALSFNYNDTEPKWILVTIAATKQMPRGNMASFSLKEKVALR